jgi:hypothetical protein
VRETCRGDLLYKGYRRCRRGSNLVLELCYCEGRLEALLWGRVGVRDCRLDTIIIVIVVIVIVKSISPSMPGRRIVKDCARDS